MLNTTEKPKVNHLTYQSGQIDHFPITFEDTFCDNEATCQRTLTLLSLLLYADKNVLEALEIIVVIPPNRRTRYLDTLLDGKVYRAIRDNDITSLAESRNNRGYSRESLGVKDGCLRSQKFRDITFQVKVHVYLACEPTRFRCTRTTRTYQQFHRNLEDHSFQHHIYAGFQ